jgi:Rieske Fe-S protein
MDTENNNKQNKKKLFTRRAIIKGILGASFAFFSASMFVAVIRYLWPLGAKVEEDIVKIAEAIEVPIGSVKERWTYKGFPALLIHGEDGFRSFAVKCTHLGCTAQWREQHSIYGGPVIFCPCHDGVFDSKTGEVLAGPPPSPLPEITLEEKGGTVYATGWKNPGYVDTLVVYE